MVLMTLSAAWRTPNKPLLTTHPCVSMKQRAIYNAGLNLNAKSLIRFVMMNRDGQAADSMFFMHEGLQDACARIYNVPLAIEILLTGTYEHFPKCTEDVGIHSTLIDKQQKHVLKKLDTLHLEVLVGEISGPVKLEEMRRFVLGDDFRTQDGCFRHSVHNIVYYLA
ncbi:mediator of RNA polymerase II transcription subunit 14 [Tanacetum coccineum]